MPVSVVTGATGGLGYEIAKTVQGERALHVFIRKKG